MTELRSWNHDESKGLCSQPPSLTQVSVIVATPMRLAEHLMRNAKFSNVIDEVKFVVLDNLDSTIEEGVTQRESAYTPPRPAHLPHPAAYACICSTPSLPVSVCFGLQTCPPCCTPLCASLPHTCVCVRVCVCVACMRACARVYW